MNLNVLFALTRMECKDIMKNLQVLLLFVVYPCIAAVMAISMKDAAAFFITIFATMHIVFTPIIVMVSILSEQKQHRILRNLSYANVSSASYLLSHGILVVFLTFFSGLFFFLLPGFQQDTVSFLLSCLIGIGISTLLGAVIALTSSSTSGANGVAMPIAMLLSFVPMLAQFNDTLKDLSHVLYSAQLADMMGDISHTTLTSVLVLVITTMLLILLFARGYRRSMKSE